LQGRFKSSIIEKDSYLLQCGKYIELNPVRAGIVERPDDYRYSSYSYYAYEKEDRLLTENILYKSLGKSTEHRQEGYRRFVIVNDIKQRLNSDRFIGAPEFTERMEGYFSIKNTNLKRGRPKKIGKYKRPLFLARIIAWLVFCLGRERRILVYSSLGAAGKILYASKD
jgi:putative transposase